jgi:hypothetical protein
MSGLQLAAFGLFARVTNSDAASTRFHDIVSAAGRIPFDRALNDDTFVVNFDESVISFASLDTAINCRAKNPTFVVVGMIAEKLDSPGRIRSHEAVHLSWGNQSAAEW